MAAFINLASQTIGVNELPLDYLLRDHDGNYNAQYDTSEACLKACIVLNGDNFCTGSAQLYSLLNEHVGTTGIGSNFIQQYERTRNGYKCYKKIFIVILIMIHFAKIKLHELMPTYLKQTIMVTSIILASKHITIL
jgi:hypothetical protein